MSNVADRQDLMHVNLNKFPSAARLLAAAILAMTAATAQAQMGVHPVILDMGPEELQRADLEVSNTSAERLYVAVEPARIEAPGTDAESRVNMTDPEKLGLLVSPPRLIVEPGERRFVRVAALAPAGEEDRIFRVAVKPVVGDVTGEQTGLKILVGYDVLVIQRPANPEGTLTWEDTGSQIVIRNSGNSNVQIARGKACPPGSDEEGCVELPSTRLYAGNSFTAEKPAGTIASYDVLFMGRARRQVFE